MSPPRAILITHSRVRGERKCQDLESFPPSLRIQREGIGTHRAFGLLLMIEQ